MLFLCYPKCSTCQKAKAWLDEQGIPYTLRDIKLENPTAQELREWWTASGLPLKRFFNTSGLQYKALGLKDKLPTTRARRSSWSCWQRMGCAGERPILVGQVYRADGPCRRSGKRPFDERQRLCATGCITKAVFRQVWHRHFGGVDRYFIPFFSPTDQHVFTARDRREVGMEANAGLPCVPQVMTRRAEDLVWASKLLADMGYQEVNLNLGCPSGTVTAKGKGAGFLARPEELDGFFEEACPKLALPLSVKTRLEIRTRRNLAHC